MSKYKSDYYVKFQDNISCSWVSSDGSFGAGQIMLFNTTDLTDEQWNELNELPDCQRLAFVFDCINAKKQKQNNR